MSSKQTVMTTGAISVVSETLPTSTGEPSIVFLDRHVNDVHPKLRMLQPTYSNEFGKFIEPGHETLKAIQETSEMRRQKDLFLKAVAKFESSGKGIKSKVRLNSSTVHKWEDVISELNSIQDSYNDTKHEGMLGSTRNILRRCRKYRSQCEQWLKLLPTDSWQGSLVCGGIKMVLTVSQFNVQPRHITADSEYQAAAALDLMREEIADSIECVPFTIDAVFRVSRAYDSDAMQSHVSQLFVAILDLLQECLVWLTRNPFRKGMSAMFKGDEHAAALKEKRAQLEKLQDRIDRFAMVGLHERIGDIDERSQRGDIVLNYLHDFVKDGQAQLIRAREDLQIQKARAEANEAKLRMTMEFLDLRKRMFMNSIGYNPAKHVDDLSGSLEVGAETYTRARARAAWLLRFGQIEEWIRSPESRFLVINSNESSVDGGGQSPVALFSAKMVQALIAADLGTVLYWTCVRNKQCNIEDVVFDMVGYMLENADERLSATAMASLMSADCHEYADVLRLFIALLRAKLSSTAVYIVIDSVSCYEDSQRSAGTREFFNNLNALADEAGNRNPLKILATSSTRSIFLGTILDDWKPSVLSVPEVVEGDRLQDLGIQLRSNAPRRESISDDEDHSDSCVDDSS